MFNKRLPDRPEILLCAEHCSILKIDLNSALQHLRHSNVRFLPEEKKTKIYRNKRRNQTCFIAEKLMLKYLEKTGGTDKEPRQCSIEDVNIPEHFTPEQKQMIRTICHKYQDVFASNPDEIPPPMKNVKPHVFKMKEGIKPIYCKRPNWGQAQRKYLTLWTKKAMKQGLIEPAPKSAWASRPVLVAKYRGDSAKGSVPDGIRTCVDFTTVNEFIVK